MANRRGPDPRHLRWACLLALSVLIAALPAPAWAAAGAPERPPAPASTVHVVERGQTLFRIGQAYRVSVTALLEANGLRAEIPLRVGQRLTVPGARHGGRVEAVSPLTATERRTLEQSLRDAPAFSPPRVEAPPSALKTDGRLVWPILGPINSAFGPRRGRFHAGIDLGSPHYQEVVAAADGEVLYAAETRGALGQAVVLQHADGLRTVYAHLAVIVAREGETVRQGQPIGGVGETGRATGPHLHFEVRRHGVPINPEELLPATIDQLVEDLARARPTGR